MKKLFAFLVVFFAVGAGAATVHEDVNVYRLYNVSTGEHFYTTSPVEKNSLSNIGWLYEGIGWVAPSSGKPVYRLYNPNAVGGDHYYTTSSYERDCLIKIGWHYDGVGWYSGGKVPVYVAFNPNVQTGTHNYTTDSFEENSLISLGWKFPSTAWYANKVGKADNSVKMRPMTGAYWNYPSEYNAYPVISKSANVNILVNRGSHRLYIRSGNSILYTMYVSTGMPGWETPTGNFTVQSSRGSFLVDALFGGGLYYYTSWSPSGLYLFHSVVTTSSGTVITSEAQQLGKANISHGCIRMSIPDAQWIYQNVPAGTTVTIQ